MHKCITACHRGEPSRSDLRYAVNHHSYFLTELVNDNSLQTYNERIDKLYKAQKQLIPTAQKNQLGLDTFHIDVSNDKLTSCLINSYVVAEYEDKKTFKFQTNLTAPVEL